MRVRTNRREFSVEDIESILRNSEAGANHARKLKDYYIGSHDILRKQGRKNTDVNNRLVANYASYIVNMATGFFLGKPVTYQSLTDINRLLDIFKYNDESAHNLSLAEEAAITGSAYEFLYLDSEAQIRFAAVPSEEVTVITDATLEENITAAVRRYTIRSLDGYTSTEFADVYDAEKIVHYRNDGRLAKIGEEQHFFGEVPVVEFANNSQRRGDFEDVITLIDAYNKAQSLTLDDMEDFTDAFLILKGMGGTDAEDAAKMRRTKIISLDEGGEASWLIKDINDVYIENVKTRLQKDIHKFSNVPDLSDESFAGNASGVAIAYKLIGLEQIRSRKEREFKKSLQRRIELISNILQVKGEAPIDFREVTMQFSANMPQDLQALTQVVTSLDGMLSQKTLLGLLPFVEDVEEERKALKNEENEPEVFS